MRKAIIAVFTIIAVLLFRPILGNSWYPMHDSTHVTRSYLLEKTLAAKQIPAIWASDIGDGAGYPLFHFYAPLMTYTSLGLKLITGSYFLGIKLTLILATIFGMVGMYLLTRRWGRAAGLVASVSYALLPYAAVNLYVRGAFSEYLAMALLPWLFYAWTNLVTIRHQLFAAIITALFLLSHNLIPLITFPFFLIWILLHKPTSLKSWIIPTLLTITLSSFYLLPLLFERNFVQADEIARTTSYSLHFVSPSQLWNSVWGYGGSTLGIEDGMSFKIGKIQLLLALVGAVLIFLKSKRQELFFIFAGLISLFMTTQYSNFVWNSLPLLSIVQFPWRYLVLSGFFVSILSGYAMTLIRPPKMQIIFGLGSVLVLLYFNLKYFTPLSLFQPIQSDFTSQSYINSLPSIIPEYAPIWMKSSSSSIAEETTILPYLYYPTWEVKLDGHKVKTYPSNGYLSFSNPTSSLNYVARQSHTALEIVASFISLISLLVIIKLYVKT